MLDLRFHSAILLLGAFFLFVAGQAAHAEKRVALVIGNGTYQNTPALTNPGNDAEDMAGALKRVGFEVIFERNLNKRGMEQAITRFARLARDADAALFYYAGHGAQFRGLNYLMPVDARLEDEFSLEFEMTRLEDVLSGLGRSRGVKILILDACRRNPLIEKLAGLSTTRDFVQTRGLARIDANRGMIVAYSTQADQVAADGTGRNSPFTGALVRQIDEPGLEIGTLFRRVAADVNKATGGRQLPELSVSLLGEFYFSRADSDTQAWSKIRRSQDTKQLRDFLARYPSSPLAADVRERLEPIERAEQARLERERAAKERLERERLAQEQVQRAAREQTERDRIERQRIAQELADRQRAEQDRIDKERLAREQTAREQQAKLEQDLQPLVPQQAEQQSSQPAPAADIQTAMLTPPVETVPPLPSSSSPLAHGALVREIKKELKRVGCYGGRIDEKWPTVETKISVQRFVKYVGIHSNTTELPIEFLATIRSKVKRVCPLECTARQIEKDGACITKLCPAGSKLNARGACEKTERAKTASRPVESDPARPVQDRSSARPGQGRLSPEQCYSAAQKIIGMGPGTVPSGGVRGGYERCLQGGLGAI